MIETLVYRVPDISCEHCDAAIRQEVGAVGGVTSVEVDLRTKLVSVHGGALDDRALRDAIDAAGYRVEP